MAEQKKERWVRRRYNQGKYDDTSTTERVSQMFKGTSNVIIKPLITVFIFVVLIGVVVLAGIFIYNLNRTGTTSTLYESGQAAVDNTGFFDGVKKIFSEGVGVVFNPEKLYDDYSFESDIEQNEQNDRLGILVKHESTGPGRNYKSNEIVSVPILVEGASLEKTDVTFNCLANKEEVEVISEPIILKMQQNQEEYVVSTRVACEYDAGELVGEKAINSFSTYGIAEYEFENEASLRFYIYPGEIIGENPLVASEIVDQDPQIIREGRAYKTKSRATAGPANLGIGIFDGQPLNPGGSAITTSGEIVGYNGLVSLSPRPRWDGGITDIIEINLYAPEEVEITAKSDFEPTGRLGENDFVEYSLKKSVIDETRSVCEGVSEQKCIENMEDAANFEFELKVKDINREEGVYHTYLRSTAKYVYSSVGSKRAINVENEQINT